MLYSVSRLNLCLFFPFTAEVALQWVMAMKRADIVSLVFLLRSGVVTAICDEGTCVHVLFEMCRVLLLSWFAYS